MIKTGEDIQRWNRIVFFLSASAIESLHHYPNANSWRFCTSAIPITDLTLLLGYVHVCAYVCLCVHACFAYVYTCTFIKKLY